ncbi:MAG: hypothetical protein KBS94_03595 [Prevotella sp.]|nr:hypothetical protein [Candidatus Equicola faecalis]
MDTYLQRFFQESVTKGRAEDESVKASRQRIKDMLMRNSAFLADAKNAIRSLHSQKQRVADLQTDIEKLQMGVAVRDAQISQLEKDKAARDERIVALMQENDRLMELLAQYVGDWHERDDMERQHDADRITLPMKPVPKRRKRKAKKKEEVLEGCLPFCDTPTLFEIHPVVQSASTEGNLFPRHDEAKNINVSITNNFMSGSCAQVHQ